MSTNDSLTAVSTATIMQTHKLPVEERRAMGKALRDETPRASQADWLPPENRTDPIDLLIASSEGREENLIPIRYGRMMANSFAFFRGSALLMASDLAHTPDSGVNIQACGDAHLLNFGGFGTPERKIIFDINDFDETAIAPWEWDVKRLVTSFVIAGRANGFKKSISRQAAWQAAEAYRLRMAEFSAMPVLDAWYESIDLDKVLDNSPDKKMASFYRRKLTAAAAANSHEKEFTKLAHEGGLPARITDQPPLIYHFGDIRDQEFRGLMESSLATYKKSLTPERQLLLDRYELEDVAIKVVGVGSVGTFCGIALFMSGNSEPLFLQFKEARQSVLEPFAGDSPYAHAGERVVHGQRLMQAASDIFLGWGTGTGERQMPFYMRQLRDAKIKPVVEIMKPANLQNYAGLCGRALARAHTRSADAMLISGYLGTNSVFADAMADFGVAYAAQNERDYKALVEAVRDGRIEAQTVE